MKFLTLTLLLALDAMAIPVAPRFQDLKLPTQKMVEKQSIDNPAAAGSTNILSSHAGPTSASATTVTTFVAQPDVPRNITFIPSGAATLGNCDVVVNGTNFFGAANHEDFHWDARSIGNRIGNKIFKTITSVVFAANCETGAFSTTWSMGYGEKLGVKRCMGAAGDIFFSTLNGAKEATAPTMVVSASAVDETSADFNGTMNGTNDFVLYFMQNYGCFP